uniref:Secreted protein n=1 Tax=Leersia perrieri TaxID=77586 RepID=A0A0D9VJJ4_9ORYZ
MTLLLRLLVVASSSSPAIDAQVSTTVHGSRQSLKAEHDAREADSILPPPAHPSLPLEAPVGVSMPTTQIIAVRSCGWAPRNLVCHQSNTMSAAAVATRM